MTKDEQIRELVECLTWALDVLPYDAESDTPPGKYIEECEKVLAKHAQGGAK